MTQFSSLPTRFSFFKPHDPADPRQTLFSGNIPKETSGPTASALLIKESLLKIPKFHGTKSFGEYCFWHQRLLQNSGMSTCFWIWDIICHDKGITFWCLKVMEDYGLATRDNVPWLKGFLKGRGFGRCEGFSIMRVTLTSIIMVQWKMSPFNSSYLSNTAIFHWTISMGEGVFANCFGIYIYMFPLQSLKLTQLFFLEGERAGWRIFWVRAFHNECRWPCVSQRPPQPAQRLCYLTLKITSANHTVVRPDWLYNTFCGMWVMKKGPRVFIWGYISGCFRLYIYIWWYSGNHKS